MDFLLYATCGHRRIGDLNVGIIWNDFLGKKLSIEVLAHHFMTVILLFLYWLTEWYWLAKNLLGAITLYYNNIDNLLPSRDTTVLVKNMTTNYW